MLRACVPGCESMAGSATDGFEASVVQKVGPVSARFTGMVKLSELVEGRAVTISGEGEGKGGPAGFAKGSARVTMTAEGSGTVLTYAVNAHVGGKLAQVGSRVIDGFASKMADQVFERFQNAVEGPQPEDELTPDPAAGPKRGWFRRMLRKAAGPQAT
jgi:carbon monoxide dehydrogenase subunit G